ncbi:hypothetical protein ACTEZX_001409 [Yersinia enterocolitica]
MFHLDNETGVPVMPNLPPVQSNTTKWFTEGGNGIPPSWPGEAWFNIIQAEILNVLAAAGITPDKENLSQLSEAITTLISSDSNNFLKVANNLSEIEAAGPAAVAAAWNHLGIGALLTGALQKTNNLSEIKTAGPAAVAATLLNLGLGDGTGRLIGVKVFTSSGTYTPTAGTVSVVVEAIGAGGAGGGALVTTSSAISAAVGGAAGSYGKARFTAIAASVAITVGSGGVAVNGGTGSNGGLSSFGSLLICPGGVGAAAGVAGTPAGFSATGPNSAAPTGANVVAVRGQGGGSPSGFSSPLNALGGSGGASFFGAGGSGENGVTGIVSTIGINPGSGGGGAASSNNAAVTKAGKNGADGIVIVWEYA